MENTVFRPSKKKSKLQQPIEYLARGVNLSDYVVKINIAIELVNLNTYTHTKMSVKNCLFFRVTRFDIFEKIVVFAKWKKNGKLLMSNS